jgi:hypothetical protein
LRATLEAVLIPGASGMLHGARGLAIGIKALHQHFVPSVPFQVAQTRHRCQRRDLRVVFGSLLPKILAARLAAIGIEALHKIRCSSCTQPCQVDIEDVVAQCRDLHEVLGCSLFRSLY